MKKSALILSAVLGFAMLAGAFGGEESTATNLETSYKGSIEKRMEILNRY